LSRKLPTALHSSGKNWGEYVSWAVDDCGARIKIEEKN
jgi:hypothetical protein